MHGGFFVSGDKTGDEVVPACRDLARMGYVTSSINYRLGFPFQLDLQGPTNEAVIRAAQDLKAAVRFFRKDYVESGNTYGIDPDKIFVAGISAGGFATLQAAYADQDEIPAFVDMSGPGLGGGIEGESGSPGYSSDFVAVISVAGAMGDTTWIEPGDKPACLAHGTGDTAVPFATDTLVLGGIVEVQVVHGSQSVATKLQELDIEYCFEIYEGQGHVPSEDTEAYYDTTLSVISNFLSHFVCDVELDCSYREIETGVSARENTPTPAWPNPVRDLLRIPGTGSVQKWKVVNVSGQVVLEMLAPRALPLQVDVSRLSPGAYTLLLDRGNGHSEHHLFIRE